MKCHSPFVIKLLKKSGISSKVKAKFGGNRETKRKLLQLKEVYVLAYPPELIFSSEILGINR
jgi:hypothetical protein